MLELVPLHGSRGAGSAVPAGSAGPRGAPRGCLELSRHPELSWKAHFTLNPCGDAEERVISSLSQSYLSY